MSDNIAELERVGAAIIKLQDELSAALARIAELEDRLAGPTLEKRIAELEAEVARLRNQSDPLSDAAVSDYDELLADRDRYRRDYDTILERWKAEQARRIELEAERQWVPVSERLPADDGEYLTAYVSKYTRAWKIEADTFSVDSGQFELDIMPPYTQFWMKIVPLPHPPERHLTEREQDGMHRALLKSVEIQSDKTLSGGDLFGPCQHQGCCLNASHGGKHWVCQITTGIDECLACGGDHGEGLPCPKMAVQSEGK